jgi:hypothetical protein
MRKLLDGKIVELLKADGGEITGEVVDALYSFRGLNADQMADIIRKNWNSMDAYDRKVHINARKMLVGKEVKFNILDKDTFEQDQDDFEATESKSAKQEEEINAALKLPGVNVPGKKETPMAGIIQKPKTVSFREKLEKTKAKVGKAKATAKK